MNTSSIDYKKLQNGSDVRGVAMEGVPGQEVNLNPPIAEKIAQSFTCWLAAQTKRPATGLKIGVGRDSRLSGPELMAAALKGIAAAGAQGFDCSMASTPAMFMSTVLPGFRFDGALMITASHLPFNRNGMKFFTPRGGLDKGDITAILDACPGLAPASAAVAAPTRSADLMSAYCAHLRGVIRDGIGNGDKPLSGMKIAVDAGGGAGGFFASQVLSPLGADLSASRFLEPDGRFSGHVPNPEDPAAMASVREATLSGGCDLGLIFDTDVDRAGAVDADGTEFSRNRLIGLMAAIVSRQAPGSVIVTDSVTSSQLSDFIQNRLGCVHRRFRRGYRNVINEAVRLNREGVDCLLAMETSGHGAMRENYFLDDGAYLSAKIVVELARLRREGKGLSDLLSGLQEPLEAAEFRLNIAGADFVAYGETVLGNLAEYAAAQAGWEIAPDNFEGLRVSLPAHRGWFLLRMSLHDPLMPLNIESDLPGGVKAIAGELLDFLRGCGRLDLTPMRRVQA